MAQISYRRHRFPPEIIQHAVWLYLRFTLSYRDVEELLAERGLDISYETVRHKLTQTLQKCVGNVLTGLPGRYLLITGKVVSRAAQEKIYVKGRSGDRRSSGSELMRREDILLIAFGVAVIAIGLIAFTAWVRS